MSSFTGHSEGRKIMAVIAVFSIKGGVGKTTLATDLAWRWAQAGEHSTLLWDLDPQGGSSYLTGVDEPQRHRAAAIFQRDGRLREAIAPTAYPGLSLIPADPSLRQLPAILPRLGARRLQQMTSLLRCDYQRIVLDCPAGLSPVSEQALVAADVIIVPLPPSPLSLRALQQLREELMRLHHRHAPILPVLSMYSSRRPLHREVRNGAAAAWPAIPLTSQIEQVAARRAPLNSFASDSLPDRALDRMWRGIEAKIGRADGAASAMAPVGARETVIA